MYDRILKQVLFDLPMIVFSSKFVDGGIHFGIGEMPESIFIQQLIHFATTTAVIVLLRIPYG